jgi:omega-6 fatty acid desaturase (delta-12 desaturase)
MSLETLTTPTSTSPVKKGPLSKSRRSVKQAIDTYGNVFEPPDYGIKEILDAIPSHCYERSLVRSSGYALRDMLYMAVITSTAIKYIQVVPWGFGRAAGWLLYSILQGLVGTGLWVIAHDCGHDSFSKYKYVNYSVGFVLHSFLLVPYHAFKVSHSKHHKYAGNLTRDTVFVPRERNAYFSYRGLKENSEDTPIRTLYIILSWQLFGWLLYLTANKSGQNYPGRSKWVRNHFTPYFPLFDAKDYNKIIISDIGIGVTLMCIYFAAQKWGFCTVVLLYLFPWIWVNHWVVHITFLQHTDPILARYDPDEWNFTRGASCTIDRSFGFIGRHIFHEILETHVVHHFASRIPFYHGREATESIKRVMGKHYYKDDSNFIVSLYTVMRSCQFVEGDNGIKMFRNINNITSSPLKRQSGKRLGSCTVG